jgi:hypothetical protein
MAKFSQTTLFEACYDLGRHYMERGDFEDLIYRWQLYPLAESIADDERQRWRDVFRYLLKNPDTASGETPVSELVVHMAAFNKSLEFEINEFDDSRRERDPFIRALARDGFVLEKGRLRKTLPEVVDLPAADDEVHLLLDRHQLATPKGHLDQGLRAHSDGSWAAANSQFRTFLEALFDEIALLIDPQNAPRTKTGETRRQLLAALPKPFLSRDLNEWSDDGKNFVNGTFKRLHPQGSHPGLSDEEDSTFRLHLVLLTARLFLRRLDATVAVARVS